MMLERVRWDLRCRRKAEYQQYYNVEVWYVVAALG